ncbi:SDR family NAD(P)-dependent oxidoreductase [Pandoraea sp. XJJ-1]|uniref:SDR family NAD(P)-dependent oxidoreductase n=1 Tax=Pandoraea sp. XJJ-1 TaxID=3002643 RepID=UPI00227E8AF2|nr:SDR family oxidoreductase [Pandoraea sp. XJJ-1]WAL83875.1 SDR family NAD(P)-dependent oxidoreductase [Pandoraea sp. XJJ-1]
MTANDTAIVTGASSGIGRAIAIKLLSDGWHVIGLDRTPGEPLSPAFRSVVVDLTDVAALSAALAALNAASAIVHAAGFMRTAQLGALKPEDGQAMWRIHVDAAAALANTMLPRMPDGGRIVLIGSRTAAGAPGRSQYAATKAAVVGMARSWAAELAPRGITVNVVAPGATETPMLHDPARAGTPPKTPPIGRFIRPDEIAALTAFLLGPQAGAITGQQILICGGGSL